MEITVPQPKVEGNIVLKELSISDEPIEEELIDENVE